MAHGGIAILAIVFALGFAAYGLATAVAREVVSVVQQRTFDEGTGGEFNFTVFETTISYIELLHYGVVFALVALFLLAAWLLTRRTTRMCPECRSSVPMEASVCRFCTTDLSPRPADA
jgi:large conductance mechanosensitive channel